MLRAATCLCLVACVRAAYYVVNVTFTGVAVSSTLTPPALWTINITSDTLVTQTGQCPAGFYCPPNSQWPIPCPAGTYSSFAGRTSVCDKLCYADYYCPNAGTYFKCPEHTTSKQGSTSKLQCTCVSGYQCTYSKEVQLHVLLNVSLQTWLGNEAVQNQFVAIVAAASGVPPENVHIHQVLPHMGNRRLLALRHRPDSKQMSPLTTVVRATVVGATDVRGLDSVLAQHNVLRGLSIRTWPVAKLKDLAKLKVSDKASSM